MRLLLLVTVALLHCVHGASVPTRHKRWIMNGVAAKEGAWPFMVNIRIRDKYCGASLISKHLVLTAAHCVNGAISDISVVVSDYNVAKNETNDHHSNISAVIIPKPANDTGNDIAILVLETPIQKCSKQHQSILLPFKNLHNLSVLAENHEMIDVTEPDDCLTIGWGRANLNKTVFAAPNIVRQVNFSRPLIYQECIKLNGTPGSQWNVTYGSSRLQKDQICFYDMETHHSGCFGDSGGPAICRSMENGHWYQTAIVRIGDSTCQIAKAAISVYTSVHYYLNDMLKLIRKHDQSLFADFWNSMKECHSDLVSIYECTLPRDHASRIEAEKIGIKCPDK